MFNELLSRYKTESGKRIFTNFVSLSVLQGTNLLLPLLTFPYLVRTLGIEKFGLISFALATVAYFEILADYGFDFSATRQVSIHRDDIEKIASIYSSVLTIKIAICVLSLLILSLLIVSLEKFSEYALLYYFTFARVIGLSIFPAWFFEGMERMKAITYLNIVAKVIFTVAIFAFVRDESDLLLVPIFNSLGLLVAGIVAIVQIRFWFGVRFTIQSKAQIVEHLKDGWHIFLSRIYVNIYTTTNVFLLGIFTNNITVGYYSVASKIIQAVNSVFDPALTAIYPYLSKLFNDNVQRFNTLVKQMNAAFLVAAVILFAIGYGFGREIIILVNGTFVNDVSLIYNVLAYRILLAPFGAFFTLVLMCQYRKHQYLSIVNNTFIVNMLVVPLSIYYFSGLGLAVAVIAVSTYHVILFLHYKLLPPLRR